MVYIITRSGGSPLKEKPKDELHRRRKELAETVKEGIFNKDQMMMRDCKDADEEARRVADYDRWKAEKRKGLTNEQCMREWSDINREFKRRKEEGQVHTVDDLRESKSVKYD